MTIRPILLTGLAVATLCSLTAAQDAAPSTRPTEPSAAENLDSLLLDRPDPPLILPNGAEPDAEPAPKLPAEGSEVSDEPARLVRDEEIGWWVLTFDDPDVSSRRVLPNRYLRSLEEILAQQGDARFAVSGVTTVAGANAYLLIRSATELKDKPRPTTRPTTAPTEQTAPDSQPADATDTGTLIDLMRQDEPGKPILEAGQPAHDMSQTPSVAPVDAAPIASARPGLIVDRVVRVVPDGDSGWWLANFEADNNLREPPLRLLPCRLTARVQASERKRDWRDPPGRYRATGEVTRYKGRRYLLPRKLIPIRDMGQF